MTQRRSAERYGTYSGYGPVIPQTLGAIWVRIDLFPRDPDVHHRHPELAQYWEAAGGKQRYRGVIDEGLLLEVFRDR